MELKNLLLKRKIWRGGLIFLFLLVSVSARADAVLRIGFTDSKLLPAFKKIESAVNVKFLYNREDIDPQVRISLVEKERTLVQLLSELSDQTKLKFKIFDDLIAIASGTSSPSVLVLDPITIKGRVTDSKGEPLPGASIAVKGTTVGTASDINGNYSIVAEQNGTLVVSFTGFVTQEIPVNNRTSIDIQLKEDNNLLNEVVVTALGVRRERKALGYSVTEVAGDDLTEAREINVANALVGRVAGLNISSIAGGPGASTNVTIRGVSSLGQTNQPLYVVNGVPMESKPNGNPGSQFDNAPDLGDAIGNLNPDDIETISVLKGAAASALYGYRAKAGVILITTKGAKSNGIEFNSNYVAEDIMDPSDWQYVYGQGSNNRKPESQVEALQVGQSSWGGRLDGSPVIQFDGSVRPYTAQKDNLENFYRTGGSWTNTIAFNRVFEGAAVRFSASSLDNNSVVPNSGLNRQTFNLSGNINAVKRLTIDARANYILEQAKNRPFLSDGAGNANYNVMFLPTSVNVNDMKQAVNADGSEFVYTTGNPFATNPWFAANNFINDTDRERLISSVSARYNFDNNLFIQGRAGRDAYTDRYTSVVPSGTAYRPLGQIGENSVRFNDLNIDVLIGMPVSVTSDFLITPNIGSSYRRTKSETVINNGSEFAVAGVYNILNTRNKSADYRVTDLEVQSIYGTLELAYKNFLYLTGSGRSDWFSTLASPGKNNKLNVFYPSVSGSFVFSELWQPDFLTFGKLRAGYAVVGQATDPFQTQLSYTLLSNTLNGLPLGSIFNNNIPNSGLEASKATEFELGTELSFFQNRLTLDLSWYNKKSEDEILPAPASITSGYRGAILNTGEVQNKGFEALIRGTPINASGFSWTTTFNGSVNDNEVISLAGDQQQLLIGTSRSGAGFTTNVVGMASAQVMAYDYQYDEAGNIVYGANDIPERGDLTPYGSAFHKWIAGWNNEFSYARFNVSFLIDGKFGGKIFSATDYYGYIFGLHKATLENREAMGEQASAYYANFANNVSKVFVHDADFIKLRQVTLGYSFPAKLFGDAVRSISVSAVGRNLATLMRKTDNIDPEANYTTSAQGLELGGVPPVRTFGFNLNVTF